MRATLLLLVTLVTPAWVAPVAAHEARPVVVRVDELAAGRYHLQQRAPTSLGAALWPRVEWPEDCQPVAGAVWQCEAPLAGRRLSLAWPAANPAVSVMVQHADIEGALSTRLLAPGETQWTVAERPSASAVAEDYFFLGVAHILGGFDHLLFVLALLLIARDARRILLAVTGFTLSHSLTLSLAALGLVHVPVPPTEAVIALSILFLARELMRPAAATLVHRHPVLVSSLFGLLHGLGFAAALAETGLPRGQVVGALLAFNVGVEVGQLAFILLVVALFWFIARLAGGGSGEQVLERPAALRAAGWLVGVPAAFWLVERLSSWGV